jgi:NADPH:quinone reductase-like Zn-dependent oxidoreductase
VSRAVRASDGVEPHYLRRCSGRPPPWAVAVDAPDRRGSGGSGGRPPRALNRYERALDDVDEVLRWCDGSFAEYATAPEDQLAAKPANLSFEQAAVVPTSGFAALQGLRDVGQVQPGQQVLVIGAAGGVGSFAVQPAKAFGGEVTGAASTSQVDLVRSLGADQVIDYTRDDVTDGTRRWDPILDCAGRRTCRSCGGPSPPKGTLVIVGGEGGGRWLGGFDRNLRAMALSRLVGQRLRMLSSKPGQADLQVLRELIKRASPVPMT